MGQDSPKVYMYDLNRDEWKEISEQCPHINPGLVFIDGVLTAVGGKRTPFMTDTGEVVSWERGKWEKMFPSMQHTHGNPIVLTYKDWVIAIDENDVKETEVWNIRSFAWSKIELWPPLDLKHFTATICGDNLILVNLVNDLGACDYAIDCESLLKSMTAKSVPPRACQIAEQPQWRVFKSLPKDTTVTTFYGDAICVNEDGIYMLKWDEGEWVEIEDKTSKTYMPVKAPIVCAVKNQMVVIGGLQGGVCSNTVQIGSY